MASKRRLRRKQCEGKRKFTDHKSAARAAVSYVDTFHEWVTAYRCRWCSYFHIGHPPAHVRQAIQTRQQGL